jgi:hypothetical protein
MVSANVLVAADLDLVVFVAVEIGRIGIQRGDHAAYRRLQELMIVDGIHVIVLYAFEHGGQHMRVLPWKIRAGSGPFLGQDAMCQPQRQADEDADGQP